MTDSGLQRTLGLPLRLLHNNLVIQAQEKTSSAPCSLGDLPQEFDCMLAVSQMIAQTTRKETKLKQGNSFSLPFKTGLLCRML